jgi:Protein of unknown function DUF262
MPEQIEPNNLEQDGGAVLDETGNDQTVPVPRYQVTSFGADYDVDGLVKRITRGDIFIPHFQRDYVWNISEASRFIESLLLGLPIPGIFLARDAVTNKLLVVDGQQRLKTLQFFYKGFFNPQEGELSHRVFKLTNVMPRFDGCTYEKLEEKDRLQLDNSILHATIIKQDAPENDDTSIYHIFERINTGGLKLTAQEIRYAAYYGTFTGLIEQLNDYPEWRSLFGKKNARLKDEELILRFLALYYDWNSYSKPMSEFLNKFALRHRNPPKEVLDNYKSKFTTAAKLLWDSLGAVAFRPERALNAAVFDSVMIGISRRLESRPVTDKKKLADAYFELLKTTEFNKYTSQSTADEVSVKTRMSLATNAFANVP